MPLPGSVHGALIAAIVALAAGLSCACRTRRISTKPVRLALGYGIALNEIVWWIFRYSHEGIHLWNLPLQLCDLTLWVAVAACLAGVTVLVEFTYFAGLAGAGMAILTPDLWSPWPSYPAVYFFVAHGGIVIAAAVLVFGQRMPLRPASVWRAMGFLLTYASAAGVFNAVCGTNYMYLCRKPVNESLLNLLGPWPLYLAASALVTLALFWLLWLVRTCTGPRG